MPDPAEGLEPDVTEIADVKEREAEQLKYYGGDSLDDDDDLSDLDRGDNLGDEPTNEDRGDEITETEEEEADEEPAAKDDEAEADADDGDTDADEADTETAVDSDDEGDEGDADDDEGEDDNVVEPEADKKGDPGIPRHRFNEVNNRMKEAERRLAELEANNKAGEQAAEDKFDFDKAEKEYMDLLLDGRTEDAASKRSEIRSAEQELFTAQAKQETTSDINEQAELRDLNALSLQAEEAYPVFDENNAAYDPVIANKVVVYMKGYMSEGQTVSDAFVSGLADVIQQFGLDGATESQSGQESGQTAATKETKGKPIKKTKEKLEAAKKAVPGPAGHGEGSAERGVSTPSITDMSDADLDKLTEEQMARLRGDYVD